MGDFRDLGAWREAHRQGILAYRLTHSFPAVERFGLALQIRRAAVSVSSNLAEGAARSNREFGRFIQIARGSNAELRAQLLLAHDLGYLDPAAWSDADARADHVGRLLTGLLRYLRERQNENGRRSG